ncbi:ATP-binding cassette sub-family A member 5 [Pelobates cultripes]|uniref:ATP-binding cassette sub-family A member 5 n=1 Tax=Pelobates cultripes TaxID=61616 RepID=A0AAD1S2G0_PELCU|nr:ATP-binding cassette sub-family A member 5 [Pelobates cultripes]
MHFLSINSFCEMASDINDVGVWRQTRILLYKNYLVKCRTKKDSIQEILYPIIWWLISLLWVSLLNPSKHYEATTSRLLGELDLPTYPDLIIGYTPVNNVTQHVMELATSECLRTDVTISPYPNEEKLKTASAFLESRFVGVVFKDSMSYKLKFFPATIPVSAFYIEPRELCYSWKCEASLYFSSTFTTLQACINSAIIKLKTNYSAWDELRRTQVVVMGEQSVVEVDLFYRVLMFIFLVMAFSPFGCSLAVHIVAEKEKKLKEFLKIMGLHDTAFWLPWVLLYTALNLLISLLMAVITTVFFPFKRSNSFLIFLLYALYGVSLILFSLMLTPLFKKAKQAGAVGFLATLVLGSVGIFIVLKEDFPKSFVWFFSPFCHCTFMIGVAQIMHLEGYDRGAQMSYLKDGPYPLIITFIFLVVDSVMYLLLASYLDQILPGEYGLKRPPFFFLKPSYWSKRQRNYGELSESHFNSNLALSEMVEPVSSELQGKEAIRIKCIHKSFKKNNKQVEALQGLTFSMYEGEITAVLGHSGTGKSTLMNILCGLCPPTEGFATLYGHRITDIDEILEARKVTGICQQHDVHFDVLTVEENLSIFASLRGLPEKTREQEINKILNELDMQVLKHNQVRTLSIGQKRKLSVAIAILGNPKVLLLDEPTAGMDSCSRFTVWNMLKSRRENHVIVFSTHCMDEADILADRKAVISQGMLTCIGTSLFLKSKWGVGYRLSLDINASCNVDSMTEMITRHISGASVMLQTETSIIYNLPFRDTDKFAGLFSTLESDSTVGVITYGLSITSLEDVFFKLETEAELDQTDHIFGQQKVEEDVKWRSMEEIEQGLLTLPDSESCMLSGRALWKQQVATVAKLHIRNLYRDSKSFRCVSLFLLVFLAVQISMCIVHRYYRRSLAPTKLSPDLYFLQPGQKTHRYLTSLLLENSTGTNIDDLIAILNNQMIKVEVINEGENVSLSPHNGGLNVLRSGEYYSYGVVFNKTMVHSLPVLINAISNSLLRQLRVNQSIQTWSSPFYQDFSDNSIRLDLYFLVAFLGIMAVGMLPYFAMENTYNHKVNAYTQLKMSGLYQSAYWVGQAAVDMPLYFLILFLMIGSLLVLNTGIYLYAGTVITLIFCLLGYVPAVIVLTYVVSFTYKQIHDTRQCWSIIFALTASVSITITEAAFLIGNDLIATILHDIFSLFIPIYPLIGCLTFFIKMSWKVSHSDENGYTKLGRLLVSVIAPYMQCVVLLLILRYLEIKNGGKSIRKDPIFRNKAKKKKLWKFAEVPDNEDEDIRAERARVGEYMTAGCGEKPAILVSGVHKEYEESRKTILGKTMRKLVANNISFCVKKGEILGLVGPNGCGKSTLLNMLVGQTEPNAGQILIGDPAAEQGSRPARFIGYSPQMTHLWPEIKLKEHLETYGAIKGMSTNILSDVIKRIIDALDLNEDAQKPVKKLSAGAQRKLCFALSMLGNPDVVLLDEPSNGMDWKAKQRMWRMIRATFKGKEQAAILTTHYMEEAEAVCDRVAIMVAGQLRYIGSVQHLKSKFGRHFSLDMKLDADIGIQKEELVHKEILKIFPNTSRQESFSSILSYKVPKEDIQALSQSFSRLEQVKQTFNVEEYSFSQSSLEQVFIELAKEQEEEDNVATMNSTLCWERRQEDRVVF